MCSSDLRGESLYGAAATIRSAPHGDVYGPVVYVAYLPFAGALSRRAAEQAAGLFFTLLTALLLFALGRQIRGPATGILLAYCWLAFPLTLYEDGLGFNDSIVAAALVATILAAAHPARRGVAAAVAGWSKLSPLALLPLLAGHRTANRPDARRRVLVFAAGFAVASVVLFVPAFAHSTPAMFVSRTLGFQALREPSDSLWSSLQIAYGAQAPWLVTLAKLLHGMLAAVTGAFALLAFRFARREDAVGLAAMCGAVLIAVQACLGYYSYSYVLWFAPLVLVALLADGAPPAEPVREASVTYV